MNVSEAENKKSTTAGFILLILMQVVSLICVFGAIQMLDRNVAMPKQPGLLWCLTSAMAVMFPLLAAHFQVMYFHRKIGWFSWWLSIIGLFALLLLVFGDKSRVMTFFIATVVGGTFGVSIVLGPIRRFLPRLVDYRVPDEPTQKPKLGIRTLLLWITTTAVFAAFYVNAERINVEIFPRYDNSLPFAILVGFIWAVVITLFLWLPIVKWFQHLVPYWLSVGSFALLLGASVIAGIGIATVQTLTDDLEIRLVAKTVSLWSVILVLIVGVWIFGCRKSGLLPITKLSSKEERSKRSVFRKSVSGINWLAQRSAWMFAITCIVYAVGWYFVHFSMGGPERNMSSLFKGTLTEPENWMDVGNKHWSEGVTPETNVVVGIIKLTNPLADDLTFADEYHKKLGLSQTEIDKIVTLSFEGWIGDRRSAYVQTLNKRLDESLDEAEQEFLEQLIWNDGMSQFLKAPWDRNVCSHRADFVEEHRSTFRALREVSKREKFYGPWCRPGEGKTGVRDAATVLIRALDLLKLSMMYHLGNDRIEEAILDCQAMNRLVNPRFTVQLSSHLLDEIAVDLQHRVANSAVQIAYHDGVSADQLKVLLQMVKNHKPIQPEGFNKEFRDAAKRRRALERMSFLYRETDEEFRQSYPFRHWYYHHPSSIDWESFRSSYDEIASRKEQLVASAKRGEIDYQQLDREYQKLMTYGEKYPVDLGYYYELFGQQLLTFVRGPKYKGYIMGTIATNDTSSFYIQFVSQRRAYRGMNKLAIALQLWQVNHGSYPKSLDQLTPEILESLPDDPFGKQGFVYRKDGSSFRLYSVGFNGIDDGGEPDSHGDRLFQHPYPNVIEYHFNKSD